MFASPANVNSMWGPSGRATPPVHVIVADFPKEEPALETMWCIVQRVKSASVTVNDELVSSIGRGICVLVGIHRDDQEADATWM
jgi:hypothetical protein